MNIFLQMHAFSQKMFTIHFTRKKLQIRKVIWLQKDKFSTAKNFICQILRTGILFIFSVHSVTYQ